MSGWRDFMGMISSFSLAAGNLRVAIDATHWGWFLSGCGGVALWLFATVQFAILVGKGR